MTSFPSRRTVALFLTAVALPFAARASAPQYPQMAPIAQYLMTDRQAEIALARSAAPPSISADAEVLVLGNTGYETAVKGTNGFVCFVERSWTSPLGDPEFWNPKERSPNCFNPPAVRTVLPPLLEQTKWALAGLTSEQIIEKTKAAFADHSFTAPEAGAFSFMMSKQGYLSDASGGPWHPHIMLFVPRDQVDNWATNKPGSPTLSQDRGDSESSLIFIRLPHWSDGTPA
jgi:hypothetical protein